MQEIIELLVSSIISIVTAIIFAKIVINKNYGNKKRKIIIFLVSAILFALNSKYSYETIKTIINFLIHVYFFYNYFKLSLTKSIFVTFIYALILMISDMLILLTFINILGMNKSFYYDNFAGSFVGNILVCILSIILTIILKPKLLKLFKSNVYLSSNMLFLSFLTLLSIIMIFFNIITVYKSDNSIFSYIMLIVIFLLIIFNLIREKIIVNDKIQEYNGLLGFMKSYESELEENKIQNHEIKNQFLTIESMLNDEAPKQKIINYVKSVIKDNEDIDDTRYTDLQYLPLNGIKGFICSKLNKAEKENLDVSIIVEKGVENSVIGKLSTKDFKKLGILLGVYLDNAIEASASSEKRCLGLEIYLEKYGVIIIITNTFENVIKSNEENNKRISTKGIGRGHGLLLVNKVVSGSKKFEVKSEVMEKAYVQKIMIKK